MYNSSRTLPLLTIPASVRMVNEVEPKRKTLAERAGEPARSGIAAPTRQPIKGTSLVSARNNSSAHTRSNSRNGSNSSFASSVGSGIRPQTAYGNRPNAFSQSTMIRPTTSMASKRPASSMDDDDFDGKIGPDGKRQGMRPNTGLSFSSGWSPLRNNKIRGSRPSTSLQTVQESCSYRDVSISTALSRLHLPTAESKLRNLQPHVDSGFASIASEVSSTMDPNQMSSSITVRKPRATRTNVISYFQDEADTMASFNRMSPKTPSDLPIPCKVEVPQVTPDPTPSKSSRHSAFNSPFKLQFLSKESNIPAFTAWDMRGRLEDVEAMYSALKDTMSGSTLERNTLEEAVTKFKTRGLSATVVISPR